MNDLQVNISIVVFLIVIIAGFIICREFFCWYWKINKQVEILKEISKDIKKLVNANDSSAS